MQTLLSPSSCARSIVWLALLAASWIPVHADERAPRAASICDVGDIDGDGVADLLVAHRAAGQHGCAWILSGKTGACVRTLEVEVGMQLGAALAAAGDVDLDGTPDVALTASTGAHEVVRVYSGKNAHVLLATHGYETPQFHRLALAAGGDWNADGTPDLACYAPGQVVEVVSGKDMASLARLELAGAGAVVLEQNCFIDVIDQARRAIAFTGTDVGQPNERLAIGVDGMLLIWSSADTNARTWWNARASRLLGRDVRGELQFDTQPILVGGSIAALGDVDGDRVPDVVTGMIDSGYATLSGAKGTVLGARSYQGGDMSAEASSVARVGDVNGDGRADVLVCANEQEDNPFGPTFFEYGSAWVYPYHDSGKWADKTIVRIAFPEDSYDRDSFGVDGCGPGDLDGDGRADLALALHPIQGSHSRKLAVGCLQPPEFASTGGLAVDAAFPELVRAYSTKDGTRVLWEVKLDELPKTAADATR